MEAEGKLDEVLDGMVEEEGGKSEVAMPVDDEDVVGRIGRGGGGGGGRGRG